MKTKTKYRMTVYFNDGDLKIFILESRKKLETFYKRFSNNPIVKYFKYEKI